MPLPLRAYARTSSGYVQEGRKQLLKTSVCRYTRVKHRQGTKSGILQHVPPQARRYHRPRASPVRCRVLIVEAVGGGH